VSGDCSWKTTNFGKNWKTPTLQKSILVVHDLQHCMISGTPCPFSLNQEYTAINYKVLFLETEGAQWESCRNMTSTPFTEITIFPRSTWYMKSFLSSCIHLRRRGFSEVVTARIDSIPCLPSIGDEAVPDAWRRALEAELAWTEAATSSQQERRAPLHKNGH
jgi:hypothetical protein